MTKVRQRSFFFDLGKIMFSFFMLAASVLAFQESIALGLIVYGVLGVFIGHLHYILAYSTEVQKNLEISPEEYITALKTASFVMALFWPVLPIVNILDVLGLVRLSRVRGNSNHDGEA